MHQRERSRGHAVKIVDCIFVKLGKEAVGRDNRDRLCLLE
jgi:hypothetical protein